MHPALSSVWEWLKNENEPKERRKNRYNFIISYSLVGAFFLRRCSSVSDFISVRKKSQATGLKESTILLKGKRISLGSFRRNTTWTVKGGRRVNTCLYMMGIVEKRVKAYLITYEICRLLLFFKHHCSDIFARFAFTYIGPRWARWERERERER